MRKAFLFTAAFLIGSAAFKPSQICAQDMRGQTVVSGGVGFSVVGLLFTVAREAVNSSSEVQLSKTPVIWGAADYAVGKWISLGACYTHQSISMKYESYKTIDVRTGNVVEVYGDFNDRLTRYSIGIRPLLHILHEKRWDLYMGARFSYVSWSYRGDRIADFKSSISKSFGSPVKLQAVVGTRYFFIPNLGVSAEFAAGPTYFLSFGITARFHMKSREKSETGEK
jgi:hypothetical protein